MRSRPLARFLWWQIRIGHRTGSLSTLLWIKQVLNCHHSRDPAYLRCIDKWTQKLTMIQHIATAAEHVGMWSEMLRMLLTTNGQVGIAADQVIIKGRGHNGPKRRGKWKWEGKGKSPRPRQRNAEQKQDTPRKQEAEQSQLMRAPAPTSMAAGTTCMQAAQQMAPVVAPLVATAPAAPAASSCAPPPEYKPLIDSLKRNQSTVPPPGGRVDDDLLSRPQAVALLQTGPPLLADLGPSMHTEDQPRFIQVLYERWVRDARRGAGSFDGLLGVTTWYIDDTDMPYNDQSRPVLLGDDFHQCIEEFRRAWHDLEDASSEIDFAFGSPTPASSPLECIPMLLYQHIPPEQRGIVVTRTAMYRCHCDQSLC